jgi:tol-pal system protein YbgF
MWRSVLLLAALLSLGVAGQANAQGRPYSASGDPDQEKRLQRLEEQIVDLNAQIGTIESMTRGGGGGAAPSAGGYSGSGGDVGQMESQLRAMSQQLGEIMRRLQRLESRSGMTPGPADAPTYGDAAPQQRGNERQGNDRQGRARPAENGTGFSIGGLDDQPDDDNRAGSAPQPLQQRGGSGSDRSGYVAPSEPRSNDRSGWAAEPSTSSNSSGGNSAGGTASGGSRSAGGVSAGGAPVRVAALTSPQAQSAYDQAYNAYNQRNYRAATDGFEQFMQRYPTDPLAGSAQFWLGEAAFTGGDYRKAADIYLKVASNYPDNEKAAESLLKLGISLKRLGENDAACSTFSELNKRYPNASALLQRADTEKRRSNC